jgi:hypothetical protein
MRCFRFLKTLTDSGFLNIGVRKAKERGGLEKIRKIFAVSTDFC